jgi:predicted mannosyl-3-phosphoglycerate phosphatase (HAD superfamily)
LRQTSNVLFIAVDTLIPARGKSFAGLDEFSAALDHAGIPAVWLTSRSRMQFDSPRREHSHTHPFIAEDGCCVYMPEDYFHLRPDQVKTVRLGRFTCIPVAQPQPAAALALDALSEETGVVVVTLKSLSPRELVQNSGLALREAEQGRQRDFDELFFFAGASEDDIQRFLAAATERKLQLRQQGVLWSLAIDASVQRCIRDIAKLYDRALHYHAHTVAIATFAEAAKLFPNCERSILLSDDSAEELAAAAASSGEVASGSAVSAAATAGALTAIAHSKVFPMHAANTWGPILDAVATKLP